MRNNTQDILEAVKAGPVLFRDLMHNRRGGFKLAYRRLLDKGMITEHGTGVPRDPKYVGLPGATFPERGWLVRQADVDLLVRSGMTADVARAALHDAVQAGGEEAVAELCGKAHKRILAVGKNPLAFKRERPEVRKLQTYGAGPSEPLNVKDF